MFEYIKKELLALKNLFFQAAMAGGGRTPSASLDDLISDYTTSYTNQPAADVNDPDPLVDDKCTDEILEAALRRGEQPTQLLIDDMLRIFTATGSKRGMEICLEAGADPKVGSTFEDEIDAHLNSIELAEQHGRPDLAETMKTYVETDLYKGRMKMRADAQFNTLYLRALIFAM